MSVTLLPATRLPGVKGHQSGGNKISWSRLFENREFLLLMALNFIFSLVSNYNGNFFGLYYKQLGADNILIGWATFLTAVSEVPFLLFAHKILDKLGIKLTLVISLTAAAIRWLLLYLVSNIYIILVVSVIHGINYIVFAYSLVTYINNNIPRELRASGQAMNALIAFGIARIIAGALGGVLSDWCGIRQMYLYNSVLTFIAIIGFGIFLFRINITQANTR